MVQNIVGDGWNILLLCLGLYFAIKYGVKDALVSYEASKESLIEKERRMALRSELTNYLTAYVIPGGLPKEMSKEQKKDIRKRSNELSNQLMFSAWTDADMDKFNENARIVVEEVQTFISEND